MVCRRAGDVIVAIDGAAGTGPGPGPIRRLTRRTDNKMIAGVASGIAAYLGIEPWIVRIGFVVMVPFGGFGVLAYLIARGNKMSEHEAGGGRRLTIRSATSSKAPVRVTQNG